MKSVFIYTLNCPTTGETRYIGKAINPASRLRHHLDNARTGKFHRANWLRSVLSKGLKPVLEVIDEVPETEWPSWECAYIEYFRELGCDLVNATLGGEGVPGKRSAETCKKIGDAKRGIPHTPAHNEKIRIAMTGRTCSVAHRLNVSKAKKGKRPSKKARRNMSYSAKLRYQREQNLCLTTPL